MRLIATARARGLRIHQTQPEQRLWKYLRNRRLARLKFVRQLPIGGYIVDFACREKNLIVELDGESHATSGEYDLKRQHLLERSGWRVIRFGNDDVLNNLEGVLTGIVKSAELDVEAWMRGELGRLDVE
jgi:very-short-patch-repair endonuclease